jgi:CheY-like chemotaxis protein
VILFVDDEIYGLDNDVDNLTRAGFEVKIAATVDEAMAFLEDRRGDVEGIICDIMMPHGAVFTGADTREGLRTGVKLFEWVRARWPETPFVVFTNILRDKALWERFRREPKCIYVEKKDAVGHDFVNRVAEVIPLKKRASDDDRVDNGD